MQRVLLVITLVYLVVLFQCDSPVVDGALAIPGAQKSKIMLDETVLCDTTVIAKSPSNAIPSLIVKSLSLGFNDSLWKIDSSRIFVGGCVAMKLGNPFRRDLVDVDVSDSTVELLGFEFNIIRRTDDSVRLEMAIDSAGLIRGSIRSDTLRIPLYIELGADTTVVAFSDISLDDIIARRKSILAPPATTGIPILRPLPMDFKDTVTYRIGEMAVPLK